MDTNPNAVEVLAHRPVTTPRVIAKLLLETQCEEKALVAIRWCCDTQQVLSRLAAQSNELRSMLGPELEPCRQEPPITESTEKRGLGPATDQPVAAYPFTPDERARLATYRAAIEDGLYSEELDQH